MPAANYYFIESPDQMAGIFERELQTLFKTTARDIGLTFEAGAGVRGIEVFGYAAETRQGRTEVELADFFAGENRSLLFRLDVDAGRIGPLSLGTLRFHLPRRRRRYRTACRDGIVHRRQPATRAPSTRP